MLKEKSDIYFRSLADIISGFLFLLFISSCTNPFAPKLESSNGVNTGIPVLSDQKDYWGVFENFRFAYNFKDTLVYRNLLADDFIFVFRNYDRGVDVSWGRDEDMITTYRLFQATQYLDLVWSESPVAFGDSLTKDISRSFSLTVVFSATDIIRLQGRASFQLTRNNTDDIWKISKWRDLTNF